MAKNFTNPWGKGGKYWAPKWVEPSSTTGQESRNTYDTDTITFYFNQVASIFVSGGGVNGSFHAKGGVTFSKYNNRTIVTITAAGKTTADNLGIVKFTGEASLIINGKINSTKSLIQPNSTVFEKGTHPIGSASFVLPETGSISIKLEVTYILSGYGYNATPNPAYLTKYIKIPVLN